MMAKTTLDQCSELQLFGYIYALGGFIFYAQHDAADGRIEWTDELKEVVQKASKMVQAGVAQTKRFGVRSPLTVDGTATEQYWEWYHEIKPRWLEMKRDDRNALLKELEELS